jgi:predicted ATPase
MTIKKYISNIKKDIFNIFITFVLILNIILVISFYNIDTPKGTFFIVSFIVTILVSIIIIGSLFYLKKNITILSSNSNKEFISKNRDIVILKYFYLDNIKIQNYFSIKNIEIKNLKDKKEIYFVGENGDGKTILLQSILLTLKKEYSGFVQEHIQNMEDNIILLANDKESNKYISNLDIKNIFAYGINRNKVHYQDFDRFGYGGLFDTSDSRRTTYLKDPFYELGEKYKGKNPVIKEFIKKLNTTILIENYKIFDGGDVDFNELSEGYKSTIIWLYDLVSRLVNNQQDVKRLKDFKAIVLIDEIDLYLHPTWKYNFVYNLREVFPHIQFIMITHSIVTILGASKDAIFYKVYKENGETKISQPMESIKNLMANTLTTSPLFDMDTARARNSDNRLETDEDFIYTKIHQIVSEQVKGKKAIIEDEIVELINKELDDYIKEQGL